ncbi:MFS transporter [Phosphitispora fastidiosa]|uniref:MFS transporter n=1 Tax=Phosphitispora fastidiosa TaxID=2837202 RepID=UPI001E4AE80A|nr:MFS transporter [Phosphitispora fastidiosa]MBU7006772.1 sugar phosphate permease [Phosphitispora fastidiosa]
MKNLRWVMVIGVCLIGFLAYIDRVNLSVAAAPIMKEYNFSATQMGLILGAMFPGYLIFNVIGGAIMDRFAPTKFLMFAIAVWSLSTAWFTQITSFGLFYLSRFIFGSAEGFMPVYNTKIISNWMLPNERGRSQASWIAATLIGMAIGAPVSGLMIKAYGWRTLFYIFTAFGFVIIAVLLTVMKDSPKEHRRISREELEMIESTLEKERLNKAHTAGEVATRAEIFGLLKDPYLWLISIGYFTAISMWWANLTWLPGYLVSEKGFTVLKSGYLSAFPFLMGAIGLMCGGFITDHFLKGRRIPLIFLFQLLSPPLVMVAIGSSNNAIMVTAFAISMFFTCGAVGQWWPLPMELFSRKLSATAGGIMSGIGTVGAIIAPVMLGYVFDATKSFYWGFGIIALVTFVGSFISLAISGHEKMLQQKNAEGKGFPQSAA